MDTAEQRFIDALFNALFDAVPEDYYSSDIKCAVLCALRQSGTRIIEHGQPTEQDEYKWQRMLGWEYSSLGQYIPVVPAEQA